MYGVLDTPNTWKPVEAVSVRAYLESKTVINEIVTREVARITTHFSRAAQEFGRASIEDHEINERRLGMRIVRKIGDELLRLGYNVKYRMDLDNTVTSLAISCTFKEAESERTAENL